MTSASSALVLPSPSFSRHYFNRFKSSAHETFQGQIQRSSAHLRVSIFPSERSLRVRAQVATPAESTTQKLGQTDLEVTKLGIGAWAWGDTIYWNGSWDDRKVKEAKGAFDAGLDAGITLFDTAEVYGSKLFGGEDSERLLGEFIKYRKLKDDKQAFVATKFASLPWRFGRRSVIAAVKESLKKLGVPSIDLYQIHWPGAWQNDEYIDGLGDAVEQGLVKAVGVSNFKVERLRKAHTKLRERNIPLASNQIQYSLAYLLAEKNGVKQACDDLGVTVIAYSPIGQGILSGKYTPENRPTGPRGRVYTKEFFIKAAPLLDRLKEVGAKYDKTPVQVSLNWLIAQGNVVPIPGAKTAAQAEEFAGALGWSLSVEEVQELRELASKIDSTRGFPAESF